MNIAKLYFSRSEGELSMPVQRRVYKRTALGAQVYSIGCTGVQHRVHGNKTNGAQLLRTILKGYAPLLYFPFYPTLDLLLKGYRHDTDNYIVG